MERLQKIIANAGICSRRRAEEFIQKGRVKLNGKVATVGQSADLSKDTVLVDGVKIEKPKLVYFMLYKPKWYVTALSDNFDMKLVKELIPPQYVEFRPFPVGRLDKDAEGLLLFTNDGDFANKLAHPRYEIEKVYRAWLDAKLTSQEKAILERGIELKDGQVKHIKVFNIKNETVDIAIHVGKHKIVKRIFQHVGHRVKRLVRIQMGPYKLGSLKEGDVRELTQKEVDIIAQNQPYLPEKTKGKKKVQEKKTEKPGFSSKPRRSEKKELDRKPRKNSRSKESYSRAPRQNTKGKYERSRPRDKKYERNDRPDRKTSRPKRRFTKKGPSTAGSFLEHRQNRRK